MAIKISNSTIIDDSRNIVSAGIATITSVSIGNTQVISSERQLQNITSLDATTTATIESAISNAPNTFSDLTVTGISTLGVTSATSLRAQQLNVSGVTTTAVLNVGAGGTIITTTSDGRIGIGSVIPNSTLSVGGTITEFFNGQYWNVVSQADIGIGASQISLNGMLGDMAFQNSTGIEVDKINVGSGGTIFTTTSDGLVGIATTNPTSKLFVVGDGNFTGVVTATSFNGSGSNLTGISSTLVAATQIQTEGDLLSSQITTLNFTGNVGISTSGTTATINIGAPAVLGWDASTDTFGYYIYGTDTKVRELGDFTRDYKNLDVQSRVRRCVISTGGTVQYYLDADDSTLRSGDWLRIVERQGLDNVGTSTHYTGIHTEATHPGLRQGVPTWSAGTYTQGQRVIYNGSLWECLPLETTATPAAGITTSNLSGTDGMVMVEIPAFSVRHTKYNNVHTFEIALGINQSGIGFEVHPAFVRADGTYRSHIYLGAYQGTGATSSGGLTSVSGVNNVVNATRATFRTAASGIGTGWHQLSYYEMAAVQFLMVTEFDAVNIQKVLGNGSMNGFVYVVNTGLSNSSGNKSQNVNTPSSGSNSDYISYRGLENIYGRAWQWVDGFNANTTSVYLNKNWTTWADDTATNYTLIGTVPSGSASYQRDFRNDNNVLLPSRATGGSAATFIADGHWTSTGWRVSNVGGSANFGSLVGPFFLFLNYVSSIANASVGGRLSWAPV